MNITVHFAIYSEEKEEASKLVEEANMPLDALLAQYVTGSDEEGGEDEEESSDKGKGLYTCIYTCTCTCTCIYMYTHMNMYMYIYVTVFARR